MDGVCDMYGASLTEVEALKAWALWGLVLRLDVCGNGARHGGVADM